MKRQPPTQIFVDDGYPEASDYDTNFIRYDPSIRGSCEQALLEAQRRKKMQSNRYSKIRVLGLSGELIKRDCRF